MTITTDLRSRLNKQTKGVRGGMANTSKSSGLSLSWLNDFRSKRYNSYDSNKLEMLDKTLTRMEKAK